ncbi:hypothetical protein GGU10DRAFT_389497 [Lentinula aff. detonsa]|uniref:Uncharacterized protein n=1 Tax=Lentinula aff. detonsa TaxID=2804958 RepID=A0AA38NKP0_9AGAR|nr:hypothetical protein GGU10DRAFT_389497 [Lentinula aff. detonsa]
MLSRDILINLSTTPQCIGLEEQSSASDERQKLRTALLSSNSEPESDDSAQISLILSTPLSIHLAHGLAYTVGSALGSTPPSVEECLAAFTTPNKVQLTAGARAWSKHAHRSLVHIEETSSGPSMSNPSPFEPSEDSVQSADAMKTRTKQKNHASTIPTGWWGTPSGPVSTINEKALILFWKIIATVTWRNLHWLPHSVLVYEIRVKDGYGMRWSQDQSSDRSKRRDSESSNDNNSSKEIVGEVKGTLSGNVEPPWVFRGFVEPMMENGHERGWRHAP